MNQRVDLNVGESVVLADDLFLAGRYAEAAPIYAAVAEAGACGVHVAHALAICLGETARHEESLVWLSRAAALIRSEMIALTLNRGKALGELNRTQEALAVYDSLLLQAPGHPLAHYGRALMHMQSGRHREAIVGFDEVLALDPANDKAVFGRGFANLVLGNYAEGFRDYEARLKDDVVEPAAALWDGSQEIAGKTVLVLGDMGLGDCIMFLRFVPLMQARGARVVVAMNEAVRPIAAGLPGVIAVDGDRANWPKLDYWVRAMSLAWCFRVTAETVPAPTPLRFDPALLEDWRHHIRGPGLKVGLVWSGSPQSRYDQHRSVPLDHLGPLFTVPGVTFYSLQLGVRDTDQPAFGELTRWRMSPLSNLPMVDLSPHLTDFRQTAHAMKCLDLVVTVDTSVAHMAGTVGVPTLVMLTAFRTYWLWIEQRETSPWYPSVKVVRQQQDGDWSGVVAAVREHIRALTAKAA